MNHTEIKMHQSVNVSDAGDTPGNLVNNICSKSESAIGSAIFPIQKFQIPGSSHSVNVFFDGGSNVSFVTKAVIKYLKTKKLAPNDLGVTMTSNIKKTVPTHIYEFYSSDSKGARVRVIAFSLDEITGKVVLLDKARLANLVVGIDIDLLDRGQQVDVLIGSDLLGLHPEKVVACAGEHLKIKSGPLGLCVQGYHPDLVTDGLSSHFCRIDAVCCGNQVVNCSAQSYYFKCDWMDNFIQGEELRTKVSVKCGRCKCNNSVPALIILIYPARNRN